MALFIDFSYKKCKDGIDGNRLVESNEKDIASDKERPSTSTMNNSHPEPSQHPGETSRRYQSIVLLVILMGVMMTAIDTTAVVLALPVMVVDLRSDILSMVWVIMAYLLVLTIFGTQVGRLGDIYGRVRMYNVGFAIFTIGSLLCGLSQTGSQIIDFRIIQGIGGALVFSNSGAIIADTIPATGRGRAYGLTGIGYSVGAILGILVGGTLITFLNWRYIFYINVPIGIAAVVASYLILKERSPRISRKIDFLGMSLLGIGLFLILYALTEITGSGWTSSSGFELFAGGLLIIGFLFWERYFTSPLLALSLLRQRVLTASVFAAFFQAVASFAVLFLVIMYLQGVRGLTPFNASLLLVPGYLLGAVAGPLAGRLSDKHGARLIASIGLVFQAVGIVVYASLTTDSQLWMIVMASSFNGVGSGFFYPANNSAVMANSPPRDYGVASGLLRTLSNTGMVTSFPIALLIASLSISRQSAFAIFLGVSKLPKSLGSAFVTGMHSALLVSITLIAVALILSIARGKETRTSFVATSTKNP